MPRNPRVLSRRTVVGGFVAATAALVTGCTPSSDSGSSATRTAAPSRSPSTDPDVKVAATVLGHEEAVLERVTATARRHPHLARTLVDTRDTHRAHVALLTKAVPDKTPVHSPSSAGHGPVPRHPAQALAALSAAESRLSGSTAHSSLVAESGSFARVLASMAAAASQQSVRLGAAGTELG